MRERIERGALPPLCSRTVPGGPRPGPRPGDIGGHRRPLVAGGGAGQPGEDRVRENRVDDVDDGGGFGDFVIDLVEVMVKLSGVKGG